MVALIIRNLYKILALTLAINACGAQQPKKAITPTDFAKWGKLYIESASKDGQYVAYKMVYASKADTLFISDTRSGRTRSYPGGSVVAFGSRNHILLQTADTLRLVHLPTGKQRAFTGVIKSGFIDGGKYAVLLQQKDKTVGLLKLSLRDFKDEWIPGVSGFYFIGESHLAMALPVGLSISSLAHPKDSIVIPLTLHEIGGIAISQQGDVSFFAKNSETSPWKAYRFDRRIKKLTCLTENLIFEGSPFTPLHEAMRFSPDGQKIYFQALAPSVPANDSLVEVWEGNSTREYPAAQYYAAAGRMPALIQWDSRNGNIWHTNDSLEDARMVPGHRYILARAPLPNDDPVLEVGKARYYIYDTNARIKVPRFAFCASMEDNTIKVDAKGRYLAFFDGADIHVYDIMKARLTKITAFRDKAIQNDRDNGLGKGGYSCEGFTADGRYVLLYDQYDIWLAAPDGSFFKKLTNGRQGKVRYRLERHAYAVSPDAFGFQQYRFDLDKGLIVTAFTARKTTGYYRLYASGRLVKIAARDSKMSDGRVIGPAGQVLYTEQAAAMPPRIMLADGEKEKLIFQSNSHYSQYQWPRFELISYENQQGDTLQGILIYPVGYTQGQKYPMVTYIYEQQSQDLHQYLQPVENTPIGFPPAEYFLNGYFVLFPDIVFVKGQTGASALDCVTAAVGSVTGRGLADEKRLGLIGHSFGGYLVNYVITQTPLFAAAVSGAGVSDPVSYYLTMNFHRRRSNNWRMESQQYRLGTTPFQGMATYLENAPIAFAAQATTPLLIWAGKEDSSVDFRQSIEMHLALRRMHRENILLLYPGEGHILNTQVARTDLTIRVKAWLDKFLKL